MDRGSSTSPQTPGKSRTVSWTRGQDAGSPKADQVRGADRGREKRAGGARLDARRLCRLARRAFALALLDVSGSPRATANGKARAHDQQQFVRIERLRDDVHRPENERDLEEAGVADAPAAGDSDDLRVRLGPAHLGDGLDALLLRHDDVRNDEVGLLAAEQHHAARAILGTQNLVAVLLQNLDDGLTNDGIVVDDQDL